MASKKITELQLASKLDPNDLVIIEKELDGTCAIKADAFIPQQSEPVYPQGLAQEVLHDIGGFSKGERLTGMTLSAIIEKLLCKSKPAPTFHGIMDYKELSTITYEDLNNAEHIEKDKATKPQTVYSHTLESMFQKNIVLAIPKSFGNVTGIVDGANVSITGAYSWMDTVLNIPGIGDVDYIISGANEKLMVNTSTVVKWNIS